MNVLTEKPGIDLVGAAGSCEEHPAVDPKSDVRARFRLDRAVTMNLAWPLIRTLGSARTAVPILMYHSIARESNSRHPYFHLDTSPEVFEQHMQHLSRSGYSVIGLGQLIDNPELPREKSVVITFDDGYSNFYEHAFPLLMKYGLTASVFVVPGFTGQSRRMMKGKELMSWSELRAISASGMEIGSHTMTHPELSKMNGEQVESELRESKETIEDKLGIAVKTFAHPFAFPEHDRNYVSTFRKLLQKLDYRIGVCTILGTVKRASDVYCLPRIPVNSFDDLSLLDAKLNGAYNWLHPFQYLYKRVKHAV